MHYYLLAIIPKEKTANVSEALDVLMAPHNKNRWDWWVVGGRWCGVLTGYDPRTNPVNYRDCYVCMGSGNEKGKTSPCCACGGVGKEFELREKYQGDVMPASMIEWTDERFPYSLLLPDTSWLNKTENKRNPTWQKRVEGLLKHHQDDVAVVVDYHC